jgi:single-stranded-DNA-specific exonuclease
MVLVITMSMEQLQSLVSSYLKSYYPNVATYISGSLWEDMEFQKGLTGQMTISLIIALDCGIKSLDHVACKELDFIICDHHRPGKHLQKP